MSRKGTPGIKRQSMGGLAGLLLLSVLCLLLPMAAAKAVESSTAADAETTKPKTTAATTEAPTTEPPATEPVSEDPFRVLFQPFCYDSITEDQDLVIVTGPLVNIRKGAGTGYSVVAIAREDQVLTQTGSKKAKDGSLWYKVVAVGEDRTATGYISANYARSVTLSATGDIYANFLRLMGFPDSYIPALKALHAQYPDWLFYGTDTGLDWYASVYEEANPDSHIGISLIHNDYNWPNSYKSLKHDNFDWAANDFKTVYDGPGWTLASDELVAYYLDPRNFLQEDGIFQFLNLLYDESQTADGVRSIVAGTFMEDGHHIYGETFSYPELLRTIGRNLEISPYYLAASIKQEIGANGLSKSISGDSPTVSPGGIPLRGYYNYYNVYAYTMMGMDANDVGLWFAEGQDQGNTDYNRPWNTRVKALWGGAMFHAYNYLRMGQNTLYYKRFNVANGIYWHQYMTNIMGAYSESRHLSLAYDEIARQQVLRFDIPVYDNMPASPAPQPTWDENAAVNKNPNNRLKSITAAEAVKNPSVTIDKTSYVMAVNKASVNLEAVPIDGGATVAGAGKIDLKPGENLITLTVTAANGDTREYTVNIFRAKTESAVFTSDYNRSGSYWTGIAPGTTAAQFRANVTLANGASLTLLDSSGKKKADGALVMTGDKLRIYAPNGALYKTGTVLIYGDVNGDGKISGIDLITVRDVILGNYVIKGVYAKAADINRDKKVSGIDLITVRDHILGSYVIPQAD
ncbi:MAG: cadherin-like beta sandwich domain-containing protein [Lachnospiraceae bacterium]|nr:cadherin-like beta sandwich domain-containing protein [Lachnospiraceae bacterium]